MADHRRIYFFFAEAMKFADIPGQENLKSALVLSVRQNKMAHAQLFAGQDGGAGLALALAYAQYIMCANRSEEDSCGTCPNCVRVSKGIHPDVHYFFPKISTSEADYEKKLPEFLKSFREFIQDRPFGLFSEFTLQAGFENKNLLISKEDSRRLTRTVSMKSVEGSTKMILLWLPEYFNPASANAILKVLEEPPANTVYLLVSNAYESLLPTITSRTLLYNVPPFSTDEVSQHVSAAASIDEDKSGHLARLSQGSIGMALSMISDEDNMAYEEFRSWMLDCLGNKFSSLIDRSEAFAKSGKLAQRSSIQFALTILRETMVAGQPELATRQGAEAEFISKFNNFLTYNSKVTMYEELNNSLMHLERNANAKMVHFHLSSRFSQLLVK